MMDDQKCGGDCDKCAHSHEGNIMMDCCGSHKVSKKHLEIKKDMLGQKSKMVKVKLGKK